MLTVATAEPSRTSGAVLSMAEPDVCAPIDANGNLTSDGTRTLEWDARNQLLAVNVGTHRSEFTYDGDRRRVRIVEKEISVVQSDTKVIWCRTGICEERAADGTTVSRRAFSSGEQLATLARFLSADHLGSVGEAMNGDAELVSRYEYDPWGRAQTSGSYPKDAGYTGHRREVVADLWLAPYRVYDPSLGRWLSEDPAGGVDGPNLFTYVRNNPVRLIDPLGLCSCSDPCPSGEWVMDTYTGGGGLFWGQYVGKARLTCKDNGAEYRWANVDCDLVGFHIGLGVSAFVQLSGTSVTGVCRAADLKPFTAEGWLAYAGPVSIGTGGFGVGLGPGFGWGRSICRVKP